jgi:hypothetical protein
MLCRAKHLPAFCVQVGHLPFIVVPSHLLTKEAWSQIDVWPLWMSSADDESCPCCIAQRCLRYKSLLSCLRSGCRCASSEGGRRELVLNLDWHCPLIIIKPGESVYGDIGIRCRLLYVVRWLANGVLWNGRRLEVSRPGPGWRKGA